ncbi:MAG: hypothetical protein CMJ59_03960 [Planctomycetaceae bacterium]|nr:hypothetical protein [Planctomycetaceae bacterium]
MRFEWWIRAAALSLVSVGLSTLPRPTAVGDEVFQVVLGERQLFVDDVGTDQMSNLIRTMHQPEKRGALIRPDKFQGEEAIQVRGAPVWDPHQRVFMYWLSGTKARYRTSPDGLHWTAVFPDGLSSATAGSSMMVRDPADRDPTRRFKAVRQSSGFVVSPDGIRWTKLDVPPIPGRDEGNFSYNSQHGLFIHTYKRGGPYGRSVGLATSTDFERWTDHGLIFHADAEDQRVGRQRIAARFADPNLHHPAYDIPATYNVDVYNMAVFRYESLYFGLPQMYHQTGKVPPDWPGFDKLPISDEMLVNYRRDGDWAGFHDVQLMSSRDLKSWRRLGNREPFLTASHLGAGAWDECSVSPPSYPLVHGDELWFYYTGAKYYGPVLLEHGRHRPSNAICLAVLRRDGFMSLDAGPAPGTVSTKPFVLPGPELFVNIDARAGSLQVEALDAAGKVIGASRKISGDRPHGKVSWESSQLGQLAEKVVRLRFTLRNGSLYSYWFEGGRRHTDQ